MREEWQPDEELAPSREAFTPSEDGEEFDNMVCDECEERLPDENYGRTDDQMFFIMDCPHCGFSKVRDTVGSMFVQVTDEGKDPEEVFDGHFPKHLIDTVNDFGKMKQTRRMKEKVESGDLGEAEIRAEEADELTDLIADEEKEKSGL